jgi:hypothetical protein
MPFIFFYSSIIAIFLIFLICLKYRHFGLSSIIIGITTIACSLANDIIFGDQLKLFYYINPQTSKFYIVISALLLYPILNIIYTMFLPGNRMHALLYTCFWIAFLLLFEYASLLAKTIVFTGWRPIPWSIVIYIISYTWINSFFMYLSRRIHD